MSSTVFSPHSAWAHRCQSQFPRPTCGALVRPSPVLIRSSVQPVRPRFWPCRTLAMQHDGRRLAAGAGRLYRPPETSRSLDCFRENFRPTRDPPFFHEVNQPGHLPRIDRPLRPSHQIVASTSCGYMPDPLGQVGGRDAPTRSRHQSPDSKSSPFKSRALTRNQSMNRPHAVDSFSVTGPVPDIAKGVGFTCRLTLILLQIDRLSMRLGSGRFLQRSQTKEARQMGCGIAPLRRIPYGTTTRQ